MKIPELLRQLKGVQPAPAGFTAFCPAHNGHQRTLRIRSGPNGEVFLECSRGCSASQIVGPLGVKPGDLEPPSPIQALAAFPPGPPTAVSKMVLAPPAMEIATQPRILDAFAAALRASGVAGEERTGKLLYLLLTTRFLDTPVSGIVKGPSSSGKSRLVAQTLKFFPEAAYYEWTSMSQRALAYDDEPISHRFIVFYEATPLKDTDAAYLHRSLLSEGRVKHMTVEKENGRQRIRKIEREGPTGLISTTTEISLDPELETRCLSIPIDDSPSQTRRVLLATAWGNESKGWLSQHQPWIEFQEWLAAAEHRVQIPFADALAAAIDPRAIRIRRDFGKLLSLIKAHAILHQRNRERDRDGQILATLDDYEMVRGLVSDLMTEAAGATVSPTVAETVRALQQALSLSMESSVTVTDVAHCLQLDPSTTWRRIQEAIAHGYISNSESAPRRPAKLTIGRHLPAGGSLLPEPQRLAREQFARL